MSIFHQCRCTKKPRLRWSSVLMQSWTAEITSCKCRASDVTGSVCVSTVLCKFRASDGSGSVCVSTVLVSGRIGDGGGLSSLHLLSRRSGGCCRAAGDVCGDLEVRSLGGDGCTVAALKDASCDTIPILGNAWKNTCNFGRGGL